VEPHQTGKSKNVLILILALAAGVGLLVFWAYRALYATGIAELVRADLPMLELRLEFIDLDGDTVMPQDSRLLGKAAAKDEKPPPAPLPEGCPELVGGDTTASPALSAKEKEAASECPRVARWVVKRHPIGLTLHFRDAAKVLALFENNAQVKELFSSRFFQGLFYDPLHGAGVRAEDLHLEGLSGAFWARLIREALGARAELHYDMAHGRKGFVFSFVRGECPFASKALPVIVPALARSGFKIPAMRDPVLEMRMGPQRVFLTQYEDRVYLANGLEALINTIENIGPAGGDLPKSPLVLTVRAEAFFDKVLPVLFGRSTWAADFGFGTSPDSPGMLRFPSGKYAEHLRPGLFKGVLAGIPHDTFAAVAMSFHLPPKMTDGEWRRLATRGPADSKTGGPDESGVALLWDIASEGERISRMGMVIANQKTPGDIEAFKQYFTDPDLTETCGGGTVFLAATSRELLVRMKESCEGQSLSVLNWERGSRAKEYESAQCFLFANPGTAMRELFLAGGAKSGQIGEFEPQWKQDYEQAKEAMRRDGEKVFGSLPIVAYAGNATPKAATVELRELIVKQGASR